MRMICENLNVTASSIFHQFENKQQILEESVLSTMSAEIEFYEALARTGVSAAVQLHKIVTTDIDVVAGLDRSFKGIVSLPEMRNPDFEAIYALRKASYEHFRKVIEQGIAEGDFRPMNAKAVGEMVLLLCELPAYSLNDWDSESGLAGESKAFIMRGLLKDPARLADIEKAAADISVEDIGADFSNPAIRA